MHALAIRDSIRCAIALLFLILTVIVFVASVIQLRAFRDRDGDAA